MTRSKLSDQKRIQAERRGRRGELLAKWILQIKGYQILERRFRCIAGEIDIICSRNDLLVLVEVKTHANTVAALNAITPYAQTRIARAGQVWLSRHPHFSDFGLRYDVITISPGSIRHLRDAWRDPA